MSSIVMSENSFYLSFLTLIYFTCKTLLADPLLIHTSHYTIAEMCFATYLSAVNSKAVIERATFISQTSYCVIRSSV